MPSGSMRRFVSVAVRRLTISCGPKSFGTESEFLLQMDLPTPRRLKAATTNRDGFRTTELKWGHPPIGEAAGRCAYLRKLAPFTPWKEAIMPRKPRCEITDPTRWQGFHLVQAMRASSVVVRGKYTFGQSL